MEFSADTKSLAEALDQVQEAVEKKSTVPILSHALVEASSNGLRLAATDLELGIRTFCPAQVKAPGSAAAPARRLLEIIRSLPEGEVRVRAQENQWVQVSAGRSVFKLAALAKDKFPALPDVPKTLAEVPAGVLAGLIDRTAFAISNQESRYTLNGALLLLKPGSVEMVATDGHRLPLAARDVGVDGLKSEERLLVPRRAVIGLRRLANAQEADSPVHIAKDADDEPEVLGACYSGILGIEGTPAIPWVSRFLASANEPAAEAALAIAGDRSPQAFDALHKRFLEEGDPWFRSVLLSAIALTRQQAAHDFLLDLVRTESVHAEAAIEAILRSAPSPEIITRLEELVAKDERLAHAFAKYRKAIS